MDLLAATSAQKASSPLGALLHTYLNRPAAGAPRERNPRSKRDEGARRPPLAPVNGRFPAAQPGFEPGFSPGFEPGVELGFAPGFGPGFGPGVEPEVQSDESPQQSICESELGGPPPSLESFSPNRPLF